MPPNIFQHFSCYTELPIKLSDVKDHILECGRADRIIRVPVEFKNYAIQGGFHLYRDLTAYERKIVALIGYPKGFSEGMRRVIQVKEMLHILDPDEATSPTKNKVNALIDDLMLEEAERAIGIPAEYDHRGLLHAMCILMPRDALDIVRPAFKSGKKTATEIAEWAKLPEPLVAVTLRDSWIGLADSI